MPHMLSHRAGGLGDEGGHSPGAVVPLPGLAVPQGIRAWCAGDCPTPWKSRASLAAAKTRLQQAKPRLWPADWPEFSLVSCFSSFLQVEETFLLLPETHMLRKALGVCLD